MTPEFIVNMLQEEFHILYSPFVQTKDNTFFQALFSQQHKLHL